MTVREFDGVNDVITLTAPAYFSGSYTIVAAVRRDVTNAYQGIFTIGSTHTNPDLVFEFTPTGIEHDWPSMPGGAFRGTVDAAFDDVTDWQLVAVSFSELDSGSGGVSRFHVLNGSTWTHINATALSGDAMTPGPPNWITAGGPVLRIGNWNASFNWFDGVIAMVAINIGTALSDAQLVALAGGDRDDYVAAGFDHLWEFDQASTATAVEDYIGSLDQIALAGTAVAAESPPAGVYLLPGAASSSGAKLRASGAWVDMDRSSRVAGAWV